jgi:hypothetical protein
LQLEIWNEFPSRLIAFKSIMQSRTSIETMRPIGDSVTELKCPSSNLAVDSHPSAATGVSPPTNVTAMSSALLDQDAPSANAEPDDSQHRRSSCDGKKPRIVISLVDDGDEGQQERVCNDVATMGKAKKSPLRESDKAMTPKDDLSNEFKIHKCNGGINSKTDRILFCVSEQEWGKGNPIPYKHLESVCSDPKNRIIVGKIGKEICTIFAYCLSGKGGIDATVVLVWTKRSHRRMGYCSLVMRTGIDYLRNDSRLMSGTSVSLSSRMLFESQNWSRIDKDILTVEMRALKKTLNEKCNQKMRGNKTTSAKINGTSNKGNERNGTSDASTRKRERESINDQQDSTAAASTKRARRQAKNNDDTAMQQRTVAATSSHVQRLELFSSMYRFLSTRGVRQQSSSIRSRLEGIERRCFGKLKEDLLFIQRFKYLEEQFGIHEVASTFTERISVLEKLVG